MDRLEIIAALEGCEFFRNFGKKDLDKIVDLCRMDSHKAGEYVFQQGDLGEHLYIVAEGHVVLERSVDLGVRKGSVMIEMLGNGRVFGCWSTLLAEPHHLMSSAACVKPTRLLVLRGSALRKIMLADFSFGFQMLERLCFLLRDRIQSAYGALEKI